MQEAAAAYGLAREQVTVSPAAWPEARARAAKLNRLRELPPPVRRR